MPPEAVKRSVESPTRVDVCESKFGELVESVGTDEQIHVPKMIAVRVEIGGVALGTSAHQRDSCIPVTDLFRRLYLLAPIHRERVLRNASLNDTEKRRCSGSPAAVPWP
ncbi:hypothetical protein M8Z33_34060 [Streptomyces sp. ZAF1911]|uniref:hypothetical protein n=1 Tax=Streptomyces sp. ZAF1911 TaxID=2944129 RepID=UPI00237B9FC0|nr:hypothetical protein [Streptomyces sp. ZAF1911]MDD9381587.1 hypothetical protein [Streptomyces sp. ZAF1911]